MVHDLWLAECEEKGGDDDRPPEDPAGDSVGPTRRVPPTGVPQVSLANLYRISFIISLSCICIIIWRRNIEI